jgi:hypothetical protein
MSDQYCFSFSCPKRAMMKRNVALVAKYWGSSSFRGEVTMLIQAIQARAAESAATVSRSSGRESAVAHSGISQTDQVAVSAQARALSAQLAAQVGPELQLSPTRLRALIEQTASAAKPSAPSE